MSVLLNRRFKDLFNKDNDYEYFIKKKTVESTQKTITKNDKIKINTKDYAKSFNDRAPAEKQPEKSRISFRNNKASNETITDQIDQKKIPLFILKVKIDKDTSKNIQFHQHDDPSLVSKNFCLAQNLDDAKIDKLAMILEAQRKTALKDNENYNVLQLPGKTDYTNASNNSNRKNSPYKKNIPAQTQKSNRDYGNIISPRVITKNKLHKEIHIKQNPSKNLYETENTYQNKENSSLLKKTNVSEKSNVTCSYYDRFSGTGQNKSKNRSSSFRCNDNLQNIYNTYNNEMDLDKVSCENFGFCQGSPVSSVKRGGRKTIHAISQNNSPEHRVNNGEKMFLKAVKLKQKNMKQNVEKYENFSDLEKDMALCTFKPSLNKNSIKIVQNKSYLTVDGNKDLDLYGQAAWKLEKMNQKKLQYEETKYADCTFRPSINLISDQIVQVKRSMEDKQDLHESQYQHGKDRQEKLEQKTEQFIKDNYTFKPELQTSAVPPEILSSRMLSQNFLDRQSLAMANKDKKIKEMRSLSTRIDLKSRQKLYTPIINNKGKRYSKDQEQNNKSIERRLYEFSQIYEEKKRQRKTSELNKIHDQCKPFIYEKTNEMLINSHIENQDKIFQVLDQLDIRYLFFELNKKGNLVKIISTQV